MALALPVDRCWPASRPSAEAKGWQHSAREAISETVTKPKAVCLLSPNSIERFICELSAEPWFRDVLGNLRELRLLEADWNGYGEQPISHDSISDTIRILHRVAKGGPAPVVAPMYDGGIQIEWYCDDTEIEVEVPPKGPMSIYIIRPDGTADERSAHLADEPVWGELGAAIAQMRPDGAG